MDSAEPRPDVQIPSDVNPTAAQTFPSDDSTQYPQQPQYQYGGPQHATPSFSIDTDMGNMDSFAASVREATNTSGAGNVSGAGGVVPSHVTVTSVPHDGNITSGLGATTPGTPGMAPPQPGQGHRNSVSQVPSQSTPYSPTGPRASIDESMDPGLSGGDPKRKRSKVSRACDECRRKKVRCDAAGDDGTVKTCTNCAKAGVLCGYNRIPMKRGPSKGYIKELSERVQQVESQMAMSGSASNYRHSTDASAAGGLYGDQSLYSPDDNMSFKRNFSFSDQQAQRSPFATSEYNRERMPSVGWNATSPHTSGFRGSLSAADRHRGSVAIAPDQQAPVPPVTPLARPFWMQNETSDRRPSKRQKLDATKDEQVTAPVIGQELLAKYYAEFHSNLPILPDADVSIEIVTKASPVVQHAFVAAVRALPTAKVKLHDGQTNGTSEKAMSSPTIFEERDDLENFVWNAAREDLDLRSNEDNLLLLWTYLLLAVEAEDDLARLRDGNLSKALIIKQAVDLGWSCIMAEEKRKTLAAEESTVMDKFQLYWARAWYCAGILARLHALAVGSSNPMPLQQETPLPNPPAVFQPTQAFLAVSSVALGSVINLVQNPIPPSQYGKQIETMMRQHTLSQLDSIFSMAQLDEEGETHAQFIRLFYDLLLSRFTFLGAPYEILQPAAELADALKQHTIASEEKTIYNPFSMHLFTLTSITLLEFTQEGLDGGMDKMASEALVSIRTALEQLSERNHVEDQLQDQRSPESKGSKSANEGEPSAGVSIDSAQSIPTTAHKPVHWTDAILDMIDRRSKAIEASKINGSNHEITSDSKTELAVAVDFSRLLKHGYLNVLVESAGL